MTKPVLFISHSTSDRDNRNRVVRVRNALRDYLSRDWEVFVDVDRVKGGERWRPKILDHIQRAQAAIVLFDKRATTRDWVAAETLMFCFRKSLAASFQFVPVLFDNLKLSDTCFDKYEPFGLNEVQTIADRRQSVNKLVDGIVAQFKPALAHGTPSSQWVEQLLAILESVTNDGWVHAADAIGIDCATLDCGSVESQRYLARCTGQLMHHHAWQQILVAVERLLNHLALKNASEQHIKNQQRKLCTLIRTKWVPNESVEVMLCASRKPIEMGVLAINADEARLLEQYRDRIRSEFRGCLLSISVPAASGEDDASRMDIARSAILRTLFPNGHLPRDGSGATKSLEEAVSSYPGDDLFIFFTLPAQFATAAVVGELRKSFPRIVLLVGLPIFETSLPFPARWLPPRVTIESANDFDFLDNRLLSACSERSV